MEEVEDVEQVEEVDVGISVWAWGMGTMEASKELVCSNLFPTPLPSLKFSFCCHLYLEGLLYLNRYIDKIQLNRSVKKTFCVKHK